MRVTNKLLYDTVTGNFFNNTEKLMKIEDEISSGKRISKPSDDPVESNRILGYKKTINAIEQYSRNIDHGRSWLNTTDASLSSISDLLTRAKVEAESQSTGTATEQTRKIAAEEVKNIYEQILQLANTRFGSNYIFGGHQTGDTPFSKDDDYNSTYSGDEGDIQAVLGENIYLNKNINGKEVFNKDVNIFDVLKNIKDGMDNNDAGAIAGQLDSIDKALSQVLTVRTDIGSRLNRLESTENYYSEFKSNVEHLLSGAEDVDMPKAMTDLTIQETAYQAALAAASRIIQPSLINFLR